MRRVLSFLRGHARPRSEPEVCALSAGLGLALLDVALLTRHDPAATFGLSMTALAVILGAAAVAAVGARLALALTRPLARRPWLRSAAGAAFLLPGIIPVAVLLFRGTGISTRWYAPHGAYVVAPALFVLGVVGLRLIGGLGRLLGGQPLLRRAAPIPLLLAAAGILISIDRGMYPNQYAYLHHALLLLTFLSLMAAAWLAQAPGPPARGPGRAARARAFFPLVLAGAIVAGVHSGASALGTHRLRQHFAERTHTAARLVDVIRRLFDRDADRHSVVFGERDCDDGDPAIYPFAPEVPGNGVDEDCDGVDLPARPPAASPAALDEARYRSLLRTWRLEPALAAKLRRSSGHNIVLIVLDALRADQVRPTALNRKNHPHLMKLLADSRTFTRAFSTGAGTDIGMATIFTGQLDPFDRGNKTLLRVCQDAGMVTHGVFQREVKRWVGRQFSLSGLSGKKIVVNDPGRRDVGSRATSRQVTDHGIRFLRKSRDRRFLLWLHYFDIHEHHQISPGPLMEPGERAPDRGLPFYRRMLRHVDRHLGRFVAALDEEGLADRTIVVVVGDHGEGLAQAPRLPANHGDVLFNPLVHVPLAFRVPGVSARRVQTPVSIADLYPTVLDLVGISRPTVDGLSLIPFLFDAHLDRLSTFTRPIFMYEVKQRAVIVWPWKFIAWRDQGLVELYHMEEDYLERDNRADERPGTARRLSRILNSRKLIVVDRLKKRKKK